MLEGLEVSVLNYRDVEKYTLSLRVDSEYFLKEYLSQDKAIHKNGFEKLKVLSNKIDVGFVGSMVQHYRDTGVTLLQTKNINNFFISDNDTIKITEKFHQELKKSQIRKGDILIARSGSFGKASIYLEDEIINSSDIIIVQANQQRINKFFLTVFFNSKYGSNQMIRFSSGGLQGHVNLTILEELEVPKIEFSFQEEIEKLLKLSYSLKTKSQQKYTQAENLLLETLGLQDFQPSTKAVNLKSLKESFLSSGRLDAEYYQPKYEDLLKRIKSPKNRSLSSLVNIKKSIEPGSAAYQDEGIPFVRVSNLSKYGLSQPEIHLDRKEFEDVIRPKKDVILLSKDGSVGIAYKAETDLNCITSGAILHLEIKDKNVLPDYLTLVLNSLVVKLQAERDAGGSIIQHWKPSEIQEVIIPIIDKSIQQQIANLIQESFALKTESEKLLEIAKRAVEIAIEDNEEVAVAFINENS